MSQIIKAFTGIFIVLFMMTSSVGILGLFLQTLQAQNLHAAIIDELENSDYAKAVVAESFTRAEEAGYELEVVFYLDGERAVDCINTEMLPTELDKIIMAEVRLEYPLQLTFFRIIESQQLVGYAR